MQTPSISYKRHRLPPSSIAHTVWLYVRFNLRLREVEEMLLERGIDVSYETVRRWTGNSGRRSRRTCGGASAAPATSGVLTKTW